MTISERLDRLPGTPLLRKVIFIAGLGLMFDAMDQGMVSGVIASIGTEWELSLVQKGFLGNSGVLGMMLGAFISGLAADRWGRRTVVLVTLLVFSGGSALCGLAPNYESLLVFRFITGVGLGGELPVVITLASEFSSIRSRGRNVVLVESFWAWGWILAALVAYLAIPVYGWRAAFFIGAVPALFAALVRFAIPESPRYLEHTGKHVEADKIVREMERSVGMESPPFSSSATNDAAVPNAKVDADASGVASTTAAFDAASDTAVSGAADTAAAAGTATPKHTSASQQKKSSGLRSFADLWSKEYRRATIVLWVLWFGVNFGYYGFVLWTPTLLVEQGYDLVRSFGFTLIMCFAQLPGYFTAALLIERIGRKPVLILFLLGTAGSAWFFGQASGEALVLLSGCLLYFFALGTWGCVYSYTPELYPTRIRGAGSGAASAFGRVGAFIAPMIVPVMSSLFGAESGFEMVFVILTVGYVLVAVVIGTLGIETKGRVLPESE